MGGNYSVCRMWSVHNNIISVKRLLYEKDKREVGLEFNHQESFHEGLGSEGGRQHCGCSFIPFFQITSKIFYKDLLSLIKRCVRRVLGNDHTVVC